MTAEKKGLLLVNLGSPRATDEASVREYLREFLSDPRVIDKQNLLWKFILNFFVLRKRPKATAERYTRILVDGELPLVKYTNAFASALQQELGKGWMVEAAYVLGPNRIEDSLRKFQAAGFKKIKVLPLFPQFSDTTTSSVRDTLNKALKKYPMEVDFIESFCRQAFYIDTLVKRCNLSFEENPTLDAFVISFHSIPVRYVSEKKDPYFQECSDTANLLIGKLHLPREKIHVCFQSRFGREEWLGPMIEETIQHLILEGKKNIGILSPGFTADCIETLDDLDNLLEKHFHELGGETMLRLPCLNDGKDWVCATAEFLTQNPGPLTVEAGFTLPLRGSKHPCLH